MSYKNASGLLSDEDWSIAQIVKAIRGSDHFAALSNIKSANYKTVTSLVIFMILF